MAQRPKRHITGMIAGVSMLWAGVAAAQSPSLKELLDKAQSQSDAIAVEGIVKGLKKDQPRTDADAARLDAEAAAAKARADAATARIQAEADAAKARADADAARLRAEADAAKARADTDATRLRAEAEAAARAGANAEAARLRAAAEAAVKASADAEAARLRAAAEAAARASADAETARRRAEAEAAAKAREDADAARRTAEAEQQRQAAATRPPSIDLEILFDYDKASISEASYPVLVQLGRALTDPRLANRRILIAGHTDGKGNADYNLALSERRAQAVRAALIENFKIPEHRLLAIGYGKQRLKDPKNPLATENRRVEIVNLSELPSR